MQPERGGVDEVGLHGSVSPAWRGGTKTEREGAGGRGRLAVDVAGLLEDLDSSASPVRGAATTGERGGGGGEGRERGRTRETERERAQLGRTRSTSGGPASKKPRYNTGENRCQILCMCEYVHVHIRMNCYSLTVKKKQVCSHSACMT